MDFAYHGGIYRDVWMIAKSPVSITDPLDSQTVAGGGVFVHFDKISEKSAQVYVNTELQNDNQHTETVTVETTLTDADGKVIKRTSGKLSLKSGEKKIIRQQIEVKSPKLWSPDAPYLYKVQSRIKKGNQSIDGGITRIGIRLAEFRGKDGLLCLILSNGGMLNVCEMPVALLFGWHTTPKILPLWMPAMSSECSLS